MNSHHATRTTIIGRRRNPLVLTLMLVTLWSAAHALGQGMQFVPIRTAPLGSPPGTIGDPVTPEFNSDLGCWELRVPAGIEIDLDLQVFGWGNADCSGQPCKLAGVSATVDSAGYDNDTGGPVGDLNPKGWPNEEDNGHYVLRYAARSMVIRVDVETMCSTSHAITEITVNASTTQNLSFRRAHG